MIERAGVLKLDGAAAGVWGGVEDQALSACCQGCAGLLTRLSNRFMLNA